MTKEIKKPMPSQVELGPGITVEKFLDDCVRIHPELLSEEFVSIPAHLAYWGERHARALRQVLALETEVARAKDEQKEKRAQLYVQLYDERAEKGEKTSEKVMENLVDAHEDVRLAREAVMLARQRLDSAEAEKARLWSVCDAIRTKKDMLVSLGAHVRAEMSHDPMLREHSATRRALDAETEA